MTKRQAAWSFFGATTLFSLVFLGLTLHSHTRFGALTHADALTSEVRAGQDVWHAADCVNCHTLLGEGAYFAPDLTKITRQRGAEYLAQFLRDPARFYSEREHGRLMTNPELTDPEVRAVIAFLDWIAGIDNVGWPPRPILVTGSALPGPYGAQPPGAAASDDPIALGEQLFRSTPPGCFTCHSTAPDVTLAGPSLAGAGTRAADVVRRPDYTGAAETAEEYLRESILRPNAYIGAGSPTFSANGRSIMPDVYAEQVSTEGVDHLVAYLASLR